MNILNVLRYSPEFGGGIARHLEALGEAAVSGGHKLFIGFPKKREWNSELENNSKVIIIPEIERPVRSGFPKVLRDLCNQYNIDVLHFHFYFALPFSLAISFHRWDLPILYHWHNPPVALNDFLVSSHSLKGKTIKKISGIIAKFTDQRIIDNHISMSREIFNLLIQNKWTKENKIKFIPNGVIINRADSRVKLKPAKIPIIGTVSNFRAQKDHVTLVKAFNILCKSGIKSELWLIGDGPTKPLIEKLCSELGIQSSVRFPGTVLNPSEFYKQLDIFVLSTHYEGHPLVLLEAMNYGLPIIATRISSIPEIIMHRVNGLLVNPKDPEDLSEAIRTLVEDGQLAEQLGEAGRRFVEQQPTVEDWAKQLIKLYKDCLKEKK